MHQWVLDITPGDFKEVYRLAYRHAIEYFSHLVKARDVMTQKVVSVKRDTTLEEVAEIMARHGISGVPVVENEGKVVGVISEKDFLSRMGPRDARSFMSVVAHCLKSKGNRSGGRVRLPPNQRLRGSVALSAFSTGRPPMARKESIFFTLFHRPPERLREKIHHLSYLYAIIPVGFGAFIMLIVAILVNNIPISCCKIFNAMSSFLNSVAFY